MKYNWLFLLFCLSDVRLSAQQVAENGFVHYTTKAGLSNNQVSGVEQDATGYIWIATASGINRFDGNRFVQYHSTSDSTSPASELLTASARLDDHRIAFYSFAGLHIIDTRTGKTHNLFVPFRQQQYLYKFNTIHGVKADAAGNIYLLTRSGFYHFKDYKLLWRFDYYQEGELNNTHFRFGGSLYDYDEQHLLIVSAEGMFLYNKAKRILTRVQGQQFPLLSRFLNAGFRDYLFLQANPGQLVVFKHDSDSIIYINTATRQQTISFLPFVATADDFHYRSRLVVVNDSTMYLTAHIAGFYALKFYPKSGRLKLDPHKYFAAYLCTDLLLDRDRQLWVGTNKGLFRQDPQKQWIESAVIPARTTDSFPNMRMSQISVSGDKIYAGTYGHGGLLIFNRATLSFEQQVLPDENVSSLAGVGARGLLVGTYSNLKFIDRNSRSITSVQKEAEDKLGWINDIYTDHTNTLWIAGSDNVAKYNPVDGRLDVVPIRKDNLNLPVFLAEDKEGFMWMASHGIVRYNPATAAFDQKIDSFPFIKMPDRQVSALAFDNNDKLWFNSANNGLIRYDKVKKTFRHFTNSNGLPDNTVLALLVVGDQLWISCYSGIACLDIKTERIYSFGAHNGFPEGPIVRGGRFFYDSVAKKVYVGYANTVVRFNPQLLLQQRTTPRAFIESVVIGGRQTVYLPGETLHTSWKDKELRITIGSINFRDGALQRYAYRVVEDENTPWTEMGDQPSFSIANLSGGTHRIQVKTYVPNSPLAPQISELQLTVSAPFWRQAWFLIIAGVLLMALIYVFTRWRIGIERRKEMVKTQLQTLKADNYKNQLELEQISHYFSSSLANKKTDEEVLWDVAQNLIGRMHYEECVLYLWDKTKTKMIQKAAYGPKGAPGMIASHVFEVEPGQGVVGHVILTKEPVLIKDTRLDPRYRVDDSFRLSEITVPILHNNELIGIIDTEHSQVGYFNERDTKILTTIATLIGNKLRQLESEQSLEVKKKELATINEQLAEARLSALQAQMNPHFVFNALNSIKRMILDEDNEMASRYLSKFALMIRMTLEHSKEIFVTLDENIEYITNYMAMEQLRFGDSFTYIIHVDETLDLEDTMLPSMMIQPLVENAIWHGLMQSTGEKQVRINFTRSEEKVICSVEDNGIGIHRSEKLRLKQRPLHRSVGLTNLRKRIGIINEKYDTDCTLQIEDLGGSNGSEGGTRAVLQLNLINTYQKL